MHRTIAIAICLVAGAALAQEDAPKEEGDRAYCAEEGKRLLVAGAPEKLNACFYAWAVDSCLAEEAGDFEEFERLATKYRICQSYVCAAGGCERDAE